MSNGWHERINQGGNMALASLESVREAADTFLGTKRPLNVCVLNAGVMALPWYKRGDGFEQQWQVNVLGHFLFCRLLLPAINAAEGPTGRIVHVASGAHRLHAQEVDYDLLAREHESEDGYDQWLLLPVQASYHNLQRREAQGRGLYFPICDEDGGQPLGGGGQDHVGCGW